MFLTATQLETLVERSTNAAQIAWLKANGYPFDVSASGAPRVLVSYVESRLGGRAVKLSGSRPNFSHIQKR